MGGVLALAAAIDRQRPMASQARKLIGVAGCVCQEVRALNG